ncbi:hypothetical protein M9Y10_027426 [Tritrichomonas musculus]|uniref:Protein kinase domain-containing protein n=1 Tax=Tritrichomonas musculus TaxID=1915356 RepID=A0ABR2H500_9EUKA
MRSIKDIISKRQNNFRADINTFRIVKEIQAGTNSSVYSVENIQTEQYFAGKVIKCNEDDEKIKRIIKYDIINMIRCQHPTLIKYYSYSLIDFTGGKNLTLIMELATNGSLANALAQAQNGVSNRYYKNARQIILVGIVRGMMYLHEHHILHRNLNPGNVLLDEYYRPHITNYGLSKIAENNKSTAQDFSYGTTIYKAPEVLSSNFYNSKSDVYSFGIMMFEILTETTPYPLFQKGRMAALQFTRKVVSENYRPKFTVPIKKSFRNLIERCLSKNPNDRPSFEDIFKMLAYNIEESYLNASGEKEAEEGNDHNYYMDNLDIDHLYNYIDDITKIGDNSENETLKSTIEELKKDNKQLKEDNDQMKQQLNLIKKQNLQLAKKYEDNFAPLKRDFEQLKKDNEQMKKLIAQLKRPEIPPLMLNRKEEQYIPDEQSNFDSYLTTEPETELEKSNSISDDFESSSSSSSRDRNKSISPSSSIISINSSEIDDESEVSPQKRKNDKEDREVGLSKKKNDLSIRLPTKKNNEQTKPNSPSTKSEDQSKPNSPKKRNEFQFRLPLRKFENRSSPKGKNEEEQKTNSPKKIDTKQNEEEPKLNSPRRRAEKPIAAEEEQELPLSKKKNERLYHIPIKNTEKSELNDRRSFSPARRIDKPNEIPGRTNSKGEINDRRSSLPIRKTDKSNETPEKKLPPQIRKTNNLEGSGEKQSLLDQARKNDKPNENNNRRSFSPSRRSDKINEDTEKPIVPTIPKNDNPLESTNRRSHSPARLAEQSSEYFDRRRSFSARRVENPDRKYMIPIRKAAKSSSSDDDAYSQKNKADQLSIHLPARKDDRNRLNDDDDDILPSPRFKPPAFNETNMSLDRFNQLPLKFQKSFISELIKKAPNKFDQGLELIKELLRYLLQFNPSINSIHYFSLSTNKTKENYTNANEWCQDINEIHLLSAATEILYLNNSLDSSSFIDLIRQFSSVSIELKYPSENFKGTYDITSDIKRLQVTKLKLAVSISGLSSTDEMFKKCKVINSVKLDSSVNAIGKNSFRSCSSLVYVSISSTVNSIGNDAFRKCAALTQMTLPPSVISIGDGAFSKCTTLKSITIPSSVKSIGEWAFNECSSLKTLTIPDSVVSIGEWAFSACSSLKQFVIPPSVKSIPVSTFADCTALVKVTIPNSVTSIGNWAFCKCSALSEVQIPSSVTSVGEGAFSKCFALFEIEIPNKVTSIRSSTFAECSSLERVTVPSSVTTIEDNAFSGCFSLGKISLPRSVTSIGYWSFPSNTIISND